MSVKADRCICNPFQIINLREKIKTSLLCWKHFTNNIYWIKKGTCFHRLNPILVNLLRERS